MLIVKGLDLEALALQKVDIETLQSRLSTGNSILFTGAGFSLGTTNTLGKEPPLANGLSRQISKLVGIEEDEDLKYTANLYLKFNPEPTGLLALLKDNFILKSVSAQHKAICSINWKRFYTTNYDDSIELACIANDIRVDAIDIDSPPRDFVNGKPVSVHLNGAVKKAVVADLDCKIKLSNSSYLSPDSFVNSSWRSVFKRDLETCSAIVFAGYSLYDFDVQKLLFELPHLKDKTYFVTKEGASFKETFEISQFGHVLAIGIEGFAEIVGNIKFDENDNDMELQPEAFELREIKSFGNVDDDSVTSLLLYGDYSNDQVDLAVSKNYSIPFIIRRNIIDKVLSFVNSGKHVLVHSDLGNGKTVFLDSVSAHLTSNGIKVYFLTNEDGNYLQDIELIAKKNEKTVLIVDGYSGVYDLLNYISEMHPKNLSLILADRNNESMRIMSDVQKLDITLYTVELDQLTEQEISDFVNLLDDQGYWKEFSRLPRERKIQKVAHDYNNQLSGVLLGLLKSPYISGRIKELTLTIFENEDYKRTLFAIALCDILNVVKKSDLISDVAGNDSIYDVKYRKNSAFQNFYKFSDDQSLIVTKSSVLSLFLINQCFTESYVKNECLRITNDFSKNNFNDDRRTHIFTSLLRFHFIEKLMPQKKAAINNYYMEIKRECRWLTEHPHYWVQYAMCKLTFDDYLASQRYLDTAYSLAAKKSTGSKGIYHTENIDTQQARLCILMCLESNKPKESYDFFRKAHQLLSGLSNDGFKFRQVLPYKQVYEDKFDMFSVKNRVDFEHSCNSILEQLRKLKEGDAGLQIMKRTEFINKAELVLNSIIEDIKSKRV